MNFIRRLKSGTSLIFLSLFISCYYSFSQSYQEQFNSVLGTQDTVSLEKILRDWEKNKPDDPELFTSWFNYYIVKGRKEVKGEKHDSSFVLKDSSGKAIYYVRGEYYYVEKTIAEGFKKLDKGIQKYPLRLDMHFGKAWLLGDLGKSKEQATVILNVIDLSVKNKNKWLWTNNQPLEDGKLFMLKNIQNYIVKMLEDQNLDDVQKTAEGILKVYPDHVETLSNFAVSFFYRNEYDKALELLLKAEKLSPTDVVVLTNIAYAYRQKQDTTNAIKYFEKVIEAGDEADKQYAKGQIQQLKNQK